MCTQQGEEDMVDEEGLDAALILENKLQERVCNAFYDALMNPVDGRDKDFAFAIETALRKIIEEEFKYQEAKMTERIVKAANPSR